MADMGSHRAPRAESPASRANPARIANPATGSRPEYEQQIWPGPVRARRGQFPVRGAKLVALVTGVVMAIAAVILFAAGAAARRNHVPPPGSGVSTADSRHSGGQRSSGGHTAGAHLVP